MKSLPTFLFCCTLSALSACKDPREDIVSLHFETASLKDADKNRIEVSDGEFAITKGRSINILGVYGKDADKNRITVSEGLVWTSSNPTLVALHPLGEAALCIGTKDWFDTVVPPMPVVIPDGGIMDAAFPDAHFADAAIADATLPDADISDGGILLGDAGVPAPPPDPFEPRADITVAYGDVEASISVAVVVNLAGTWQVFLDGAVDKPIVELTFTQSGRRLADDLSEVYGEIHGDQLLLTHGPLSLQGTLRSLVAADGVYGFGGTWSAVRVPTVTAAP